MRGSLLERLADEYAKFSKGQRRVAEYILTDFHKAAFMTAAELGSAAGVSESTVVRFAYMLGLDGYPAMQKDLQSLLQNEMTTVQRLNMMEGLTSPEIVEASFKTDISNLRVTAEKNAPEIVDEAVDILDGCRTLYVTGTRSSWPLVQFLDYYLRYMMSNVRVIRFEGSDIYSQTLGASSEDALLAVSFPRYSSRTMEVVEHLRSKGASIVSISDRADSPPGRLSTCALVAKSHMHSFVDSFVAPLALINVLIIKLGLKRKSILFKNFEELERHWAQHAIYAEKSKTREDDDTI